MKKYVTTPSENFAERENQVGDYHPDLCYQHGQTHAAYGWAATDKDRGDWNREQKDAYYRGWQEASGR